jgi:anaerobic magnesium-protoporphyrin IX monomethyl ester cyclase
MRPQVALITPPSVFLLDERVFVNLGILKIAAVLERDGYPVDHLDLSGVENYLDALRAYLASTRATFAGITATTPQLPSVTKIVATIRESRPDLRVILGGPHVTLTVAAAKLERRGGHTSRAHHALSRLTELADVLVAGDGELAIFEALRPDASGVIDGDDPRGGLVLTSQRYDATPYPARHLVDLESYRYEIDGRRATSLIAQLGCPFGCGFCGGRSAYSLRTIRTRSISSIVGEIRELHQTYGYTGFMFYDDELNVNRDMVPLMCALANLQAELGVDFRFRGFIKAQLFTADQAFAMYRAGFRWMLTGFESGAPRILENINKRSTRDENSRCMEFARAAGLKVKALMSIGHPGETEATVRDTQAWLLDTAPDDFDCTIITTYPGTPYYDEAVPHAELPEVWTYTYRKTGDRLHAHDVDFLSVADYYKGDPHGGYRSFVFTDALGAEQIVELRSWVEESVRSSLRIPYPQARRGLTFEHSMGQGLHEALPKYLLNQRARAAGA